MNEKPDLTNPRGVKRDMLMLLLLTRFRQVTLSSMDPQEAARIALLNVQAALSIIERYINSHTETGLVDTEMLEPTNTLSMLLDSSRRLNVKAAELENPLLTLVEDNV